MIYPTLHLAPGETRKTTTKLTARHAAKRKAVRSDAHSKLKTRKIDDHPPERDSLDQPSVNFVNCPYYESTKRRVVCVSDSEQIEADKEGFGSTLATPELDSAMGDGSWIIPSNETKDESDRQVVCVSDSEQVEKNREGFGSTTATPELDSDMGVGSWIILSKETKDESKDVYRQLKELVDEPVASERKGEPHKSKSKIGMKLGMKKGSKSQICDSRV